MNCRNEISINANELNYPSLNGHSSSYNPPEYLK